MLIKVLGKEILSIGKAPVVLPSLESVLRYFETIDRSEGKINQKNAYKKQAWIYSIVSLIAGNIARAPYRIYSDPLFENEITSGPAFNFFNTVNPFLSKFQLWEGTMTYKSLRGESFWRVMQAGNVTEMEFLEPLNMKPEVRDGELIGWTFRTDKGNIPLAPEEVFHIKYFNPDDSIRGQSPLQAAMKSINIDFAAMNFNESLMKNGVYPSSVVEVEHQMTDPSFERFKLQLEQRHRGSEKAGKLMILENGAKYIELKLTPEEVKYIEQRKMSKEEMHAVYHVNMALTGATEKLNRANINPILTSFWSMRLQPEMTAIENALQTNFFPIYFPGQNIFGRFDTSEIPELQEALESKIKSAKELFTMGFTANEINKKLELGFEDKPWRDEWWIQFNMIPAGDAGEATTPPERTPPIEDMVNKFKKLGSKYKKEQDGLKKHYIHWKLFINQVQPIINKYRKALEKFIFELRSEVLNSFFESADQIVAETERYIADQAENKEVKIDVPLFNKEEATKKLIEMSAPHIETAIIAGGNLANAEIGVDAAFEIVNDATINFFNTQKAEVAQILDTIELNLDLSISRGIEAGETIDDIANSVRHTMNVSINRSKLIARTEVIGSANGGRFNSYKEHGVEKKQWINSFDDDVRSSHQISEIIPLDQLFSMGLRWPGDKSGDVSEIANCRCTLGAVI